MSLKSLESYDNIEVDSLHILRLPEPNESDADCLMRTYVHPSVEKYIPDDLIPRDLEHGKDILNHYRFCGYDESRKYWSIARKSDNKMIGLAGFCDINHYNSRAEIAYELDPEYWRQGIMTKVVKKLMNLMFKEIGVKRIQANVLPDNFPSLGLLQKVGFVKEGVLESYRLFKGKHTDVVMLGYSADKYFRDMERVVINTNPIKFSHIPSHNQILRVMKKHSA